MNSPQPPPLENWEAVLDRAIKKLPERQAPASLMPVVMARIQSRSALPWHRLPWLQWPLALRAASAVAMGVLLAVLLGLAGQFWKADVSPWLDPWRHLAQTVCTAFAAALDSILGVQPGAGCGAVRLVLLVVGLLLFAMYLTCIGVGTVVYRTVRK